MEMVILMGLQASGKSTFCRRELASTHVHISKDLMVNNRHPGRRQSMLIEEAFAARHSVVIDNTNATATDRDTLIHQARQWGATVTGYLFESSVSQSRERNSRREGRDRVPDVAIFATAKKFALPDYSEGFDALWKVSIGESGMYALTPWPLDVDELS